MNDTNMGLITTLSVLWGLFAAGLTLYIGSLSEQITYVTLADGRKQERSLPLLIRMLLPLAPNFTRFFRKPMFKGARATTARRITAAGFDGLITDEELLALRVVFPLFIGPLLILFVRGVVFASHMHFLKNIEVPLDLLGLLWLCMYPVLWLRRALELRHRSMRKALPFVLDLLTLSVEAGMDFMTSLQRNVERRVMDPLNEEPLAGGPQDSDRQDEARGAARYGAQG